LVLVGLLLISIPAVASLLTPEKEVDNAASSFTAHQALGLSNPLGEESTLSDHVNGVFAGIRSALANPLGIGVGSVTIGADKYGGRSAPTEADPGDSAVIAGMPGLLAYLLVTAYAFSRAFRLAAWRRDRISLCALGFTVVASLHWLTGGQYAVSFIAWLVIGWIDREASLVPPKGKSDEEAADLITVT